ncbi:MAG: peptidase M23 [Lysobacterales bacterium CG02_land_8_20_14_3_00_62_12]|nr:MAG: peptidase M23 [Xanthomonadales bacterium CG02_land_8_20_14_3_00_62_12]
MQAPRECDLNSPHVDSVAGFQSTVTRHLQSRARGCLLLGLCLPGLSCANALELPTLMVQGGLIIGRSVPPARIDYAGKPLRVAADGSFLIGIGRDATGSIVVHGRFPDGSSATASVAIQQRDYAIERVAGVAEAMVNPPPEIARRIEREQAEVALARQRDDDRQDYRFGFSWPARGRISGVYGSQRILNGSPKNPHYGVDIAAANDTPILAPAGGIISFARSDLYLTGGTVLIDHGHGLSSVFVHLSRLDVGVGDRVEAGQRIGLVGATGRATGPHLHWGMNWFEIRLDPQLLVAPMP